MTRKKYTYDEVIAAAKDYFKGDELAAQVSMTKYALKDEQGNFFELSPNDMILRYVSEFYRIEQKYQNQMSEAELFELFDHYRYLIPGGSGMSGIGNNLQVQSISNCFVTGNKSDSYGGVMLTDQQSVQLMKRRGGVGLDMSHIRPKGTKVKNSARTSTGVVPFMDRYSNSTKEVAQDGRR